MLVKKKNSQWQPSENPGLAVGETIDVTDPKSLILAGDVVGLGKHGEELSAYELYGVIVTDEKKEFEAYIAMKKQEALKTQLEKEQKELEAIKTQADKEKKEKEEAEARGATKPEASVAAVAPKIEKKK